MVTGMTEDALVSGKIYGAIQNPRVKVLLCYIYSAVSTP